MADWRTDKSYCRGCDRQMETTSEGTPLAQDGNRAPRNYFGGYVCSHQCDRNACLRMLSSMPGAGLAKHLDSGTRASVESNWTDR